MDRGLATVIGMSIAYVASFVGLVLAWVGWRKRHDGDGGEPHGRDDGGDDRGEDGGIRASLLFLPAVPGVQDVGAADSLPAPALPGGPLWSVIVPALLFLVALGATVLLYRRFTRGSGGGGGPRS